MMKYLIVSVSLITAIAFLAISALSSLQIFNEVIASGEEIRSELWLLIILCFLGGVIMIGIAWAIVELSEARKDNLQAHMIAPNASMNDE